jgi:hypothetical protein
MLGLKTDGVLQSVACVRGDEMGWECCMYGKDKE